MRKIKVVAQKDFIQSVTTSSRPLPALAELIWNGFDSGSDEVEVSLQYDEMDGLHSITVQDFGSGIDFSNVEGLFGSLGSSWKKLKIKNQGRMLHGRNGRGRFKAFSLGQKVEWHTVYKLDDVYYRYTIVGVANELDDFQITLPVVVDSAVCGTTVVVSGLSKNFTSLQDGSAKNSLAKLFATYLVDYPETTLVYDGDIINPKDAQVGVYNYDLYQATDDKYKVIVSIVEWKTRTDRTIHLCSRSGFVLHEISSKKNIRAPGFNFTVYINSDYFQKLDEANLLDVAELDRDAQQLIDDAISKVRAHFRERLAEKSSEVVAEWKKQKIYPYEDKDDIGPVEVAERQVFDIIAVNVQNYLPNFEKSDVKSKKFTFKLLSQAIKQNPESVQVIINEVLGLKKEAQDDLAGLLKKTTLSSIISAAKVVSNRLNFLDGLHQVIFDKEGKKKLLERDQLHKILNSEAWIFNEEFTLAGSEKSLENVLQQHIHLLGEREDKLDPIELSDGRSGRVDLLLHKAISPRAGEYDYLIVELKRPSKKIDSDVITQIKKYAMAVSSDERFHGIKVRWTFLAVSNEIDDYARSEATQKNKPFGLIFEPDNGTQVTAWVKTWSDIINEAKSKLLYINKQLNYEVDSDSSREYLLATHSKFIPQLDILQNKPVTDFNDIISEIDA
ncbi:ATP-binding protein [Vogesella sp. EB]|uniref:ATP-binding protein n=1 Tax=Vogesella sp. EB TaxID=1526735 RepID=UPI0009E1F5B6|nr:ATP-binding protein [Vogesella sp. EB]